MHVAMKGEGIISCLLASIVLVISLTSSVPPLRGLPQATESNFLAGLLEPGSDAPAMMAVRSVGVQESGREARVPGGRSAALRVMGGRTLATAKDYFLAVARIAMLTDGNMPATKELQARVREHFRTVKALEAFGKPAGGKYVVCLSSKTSETRKTTKEILDLLGYRMESSQAGTRVFPALGGLAAKQQITTAALAFNQVAMQEALQNGRDFEIAIPEETVPLAVGDEWQREALLENGDPPGGISEVLATNRDLEYFYIGLCSLDEESARELLRLFGLRTLQEKYARLLFRFPASLVVRDGRVQVPGGPAAGPVWQQLLGVSNSSPKLFLAGLFSKDEGKMLAFFAALMQLDSRRQRFFTASAGRAAIFYELIKNSPDVRYGVELLPRRMPLADFFRQIPLDANGHVVFPGGPQPWIVAGNPRNSPSEAPEKVSNEHEPAAPDVEDRIIANLARATFMDGSDELTGLDTFLAVDHLNAHRLDPLDETSVSLLVRNYPQHRWVWPYLVALEDLRSEDYGRFFRLSEHLRSANSALVNDALGELHGLLKMLCLLCDSGSIPQERASHLFREICDRFLAVKTAADCASASLDLMVRIADISGTGSGDPDDAVRDSLLGHLGRISFTFHGEKRVVDITRNRSNAFREVLELQKVPTLAPLLDLYRMASRLSNSQPMPDDLPSLVKDAVGRLPEVEIAPSQHLESHAKTAWIHFRLDDVRGIAGLLVEAAGAKSHDREKIKSLSKRLLAALNPQVRLAITGILYAYYFCPSDLLISDDPLLLRKHRFVSSSSGFGTSSIWEADDLVPGEQSGSFFVGGMADFGNLAGKASMSTLRQINVAAAPVGAAIVGSLHETRWGTLHNGDLRLVSLRIRTAREWIARAPDSPELLSALSETTTGLLSPSRRAELLQALPGRDWTRITKILTLSDLYFLGEEYSRGQGDKLKVRMDPGTLELQSAQYPPGGIRWLGANPRALSHCSHPHLMRMASYEYYEEFITPYRLAARANEFKLYLAEYFERHGLPPEIMGAVAEPIAIAVLHKMKMTTEQDWRAILAAFAEINDQMLDEALTEK